MLEAAIAVAGTATGVTLINKVSDALGWWTAPHQQVRMAKHEAIAARIRTESDIETADLIRKAAQRVAKEEIQHQHNMESILLKAMPHLQDDAKPKEMQTDWIVNLFDKARIVSDDAMQEHWAKLLAGEANSPNSYSRKTVNLLADLDSTSAQLFNTYCRFCVQIGGSRFPCILAKENGGLHEIYEANGFGIKEIVELTNLGLISMAMPSGMLGIYMGQAISNVPEQVTIRYGENQAQMQCPTNRLTYGITALTQSGIQMAQMCLPTSPIDGFFEFICENWPAMCKANATLRGGFATLAYVSEAQ